MLLTTIGGARVYNDGAASNNQGVAYLYLNGNGFRLDNVPAANRIEIMYASRYTGKISVYVNSNNVGDLRFKSNDRWTSNYTSAIMDINIPKDASLQIKNDGNGDSPLNIDYINFISGKDLPRNKEDIVLKLVENPVKDILSIQGVYSTDILYIYNITGSKVQEGKGSQLNVSELNKGIYLVKIIGRNQILKFVKN